MFLYVERPVKRKAAQDLARYDRDTVDKKRKGEYCFRQLQETAMAHEEQGDCSLAEVTSLEVQNSPLDPENKDGTAEVAGGTVYVVTMTDKVYTGLQSFATLMAIFRYVSALVMSGPRTTLTAFQQFLMVLIKLRLNLVDQDIAYRFGVHQSTVS